MSSEPIPHGTTLIIRGGRVMLPGGNWHEPEAHDIAVAGDTITGVAGRFAPAAGTPIEELDARGHLVLPGFVNAHYHSHDVLAKGALEEVRSRPGGFTRCRRSIRPAPWRKCAPAPCSARSSACARA
jgi:5-methylthioadenosine/S-adenosylhomocysteine deaminase